MENCFLRHPSIEKILWNEMRFRNKIIRSQYFAKQKKRLFHEFKFTLENFAKQMKLKLEIYRSNYFHVTISSSN